MPSTSLYMLIPADELNPASVPVGPVDLNGVYLRTAIGSFPDVPEGSWRFALAQVQNAPWAVTIPITAPAQFGVNDWSVADRPSAGGNMLRITIINLPDDGGSPLTALQYTLDGGATWTDFVSVAVGARDIMVPAAPTASTPRIRATNIVGEGLMSAGKTMTPSVLSGLTAAPLQTVSTFSGAYGVGLTFSAPTGVQQYQNGDIHVRTNSAGSLTGLTPVSQVVNSYWQGGVMRNLLAMTGTDAQGLDELATTYPGSDTVVRIDYNHALNLHPSVSGPITWAANESFSLTLSVRRTDGAFNPATQHSIIDRLINITFSPDVVNVGDFTPSQAAVSKASVLNWSDVQIDRLPKLVPYSGMINAATALLRSEPEVLTGYSGESKQRITTLWRSGDGGGEYEGGSASNRAEVYHWLCSNVSNAEKEPVLRNVLQFAVAVKGNIDGGRPGSYGAGQHFDRGLALLTAYCVTHDPIWLEAFRSSITVTFAGYYMGSATEVGKKVRYLNSGPGNGYRLSQTVFPEHVGRPIRRGVSLNTQLGGRYQEVSMAGHVAEWLAAMVMQGPNGYIRDEISSGADETSQNFAASMQRAGELASFRGADRYGSRAPKASHCSAWLAWLPASGYTPPQVEPVQIDVTWSGGNPLFNNQTVRASGGAGSITFDYADFAAGDYSMHPVTSVDYFISKDGVQKLAFLNQGYSPTISQIAQGTPIPAGTYHVGTRLQNAYGAGIWSPSFIWTDAPASAPNLMTRNPRFTVAVTAASTTAAAPVNVIPPLVHYDIAPEWAGEEWRVLPNNVLPANTGAVRAGSGFWRGYPEPVVSHKWQRNVSVTVNPIWEDIIGAVNAEYTFVSADIGKQIRLASSASNASGTTVWLYSTPFNGPSAQVLPQGIVFQTEFKNDFPLFYPDQFAATVAGNGNKTHSASVVWGELETSSGGIGSDKTAGHPYVEVPLGVYPAGNYRVVGYVPVGLSVAGETHANFDWNQNGNAILYTKNGAAAAVQIATAVITKNVVGQPYVYQFSFDITLPTALTVIARVRVATATGGTVGGDPSMTFLQMAQM